MNKKNISILLGAVCILLTTAIAIQIRTISSTIAVSDPTFADDELRDEVLRMQERYTEAYKELENLSVELEKQRANATENDTLSTEKENELKIGEAILGNTDVSGKGVIITLDDSKSASLETLGQNEDANKFIVHDEDVLRMVNELRNAGAEAISVNDQRIISTSSIMCVGNMIRINGEKVGAPFVIKAIGKQDELYNAIKRAGGYLEILNLSKISNSIEKVNNLKISKYNGVVKFKYMKEAK